MSSELTVILRTCVHSDFHKISRYIEAPRDVLILTCIRSLGRAVRKASELLSLPIRITVVDDHSDRRSQEQIRSALGAQQVALDWIGVEGSGNGDSLRTAYEYARWNCQDLIYFVEDDYLHYETSILEMLESMRLFRGKTGRDCVLHPYDCPDRYLDNHVYESYLVLGSHRHWRTVRQTTGTFLLSRETLMTYWKHYLDFSLLDKLPGHYEADTINQVYKEVACFSPIPSLALHVSEEASKVPFLDWGPLWAESKLEAP